MESELQVFKAIPIHNKDKKRIPTKKVFTETVKKGFIFSDEIYGNYSDKQLLDLIDLIDEKLCLSSEEMNSSFHKSWQKVKNSSTEKLVLEQMLHYITTYGFETLGIYSSDSVYIPLEKLDLPNIDNSKIKLFVIKGYTKQELVDKTLNYVNSGLALSQDTLDDCHNIIINNHDGTFSEKYISTIKNNEFKVMMFLRYSIVPKDPVEFLRFVIYLKTSSSLLIKDEKTITNIKNSAVLVSRMFETYIKENGVNKLSTIFYRYKPLFLAFKTEPELKSVINCIRREAVKHHKPCKEDYLNNVTINITKNDFSFKRLHKELSNVPIFRRVRLAMALKYRTLNPDSIMYKIRNGKSYSTKFRYSEPELATDVYNEVMDNIYKTLSKNVKGKKIYLPKEIVYAFPTSEKQFTGDIPNGSYVPVTNDMVVGVHWNNVDGNRIDLDLSMVHSGGKCGWDAQYKNADVMFSGDMTDAENGASELFYVKTTLDKSQLLYLNYYNFTDIKVPYTLFIAKEKCQTLDRNYMVDPNNVIINCKNSIDKKQNVIGLLLGHGAETRFYFANTAIGNKISSHVDNIMDSTLMYLDTFYRNQIELKQVLEKSGAIITSDKTECDIDLSLENISKEKLIEVITQ